MVLNSGSARISIVFRGSEGLHPSGVALLLSQAPWLSPLCAHRCLTLLCSFSGRQRGLDFLLCNSVFLCNFTTKFFIQCYNYVSMSLVVGREAGAGGHEFVLQKTLVMFFVVTIWGAGVEVGVL